LEPNPAYTVPPPPHPTSSDGLTSTRPGWLIRAHDLDVPQILLAGVLTVLCPVLVSPTREAYRRAVVILVLLIVLVIVTRVPMEFPQLPEIPELPPLPPTF
jgi:hypothetical protein